MVPVEALGQVDEPHPVDAFTGKELDVDDGELTRINKVRRGYIADKYLVLVDAFYGGKTEQYVETQVKFEDGRTGSVSATLKIVDTKTFAPVKAAA